MHFSSLLFHDVGERTTLGDLREKLSQTQEKKGTILMVYKFGENDTSLKKLC